VSAPSAAQDAAAAACLLAADPAGLGGAVLRARPGPERDRFLALLRSLLPTDAPWRRMPAAIADDALLGGLDLALTLASRRPIRSTGLLEAVRNGVLVIPMAERLPRATVARVTAGQETEGFGIVALDEGLSDEEGAAPALMDRLALLPDLAEPPAAAPFTAAQVAEASRILPSVTAPEEMIEALLATCAAAGILSLRAPALALRAARVAAALNGRRIAVLEDAALAVRLVLAPRALTLPEMPPEPEPPPPEPENQPPKEPENREQGEMEDVVRQAANATLPAQLLAALAAPSLRLRANTPGRVGASRASALRGRPIGIAPGDPRSGARLALLETLRAAAPWQRLRTPSPRARVVVRREDFRIRRFRENAQSTAIFVVDASGSSALHRLAEAKGAVELLLAECYARRDRVAVVAFRRQGAEALLPPTHSLVRAKRALAGLPGGGTSPLAAGLDAALALLRAERRAGRSPLIVVLTDGRANIARDGRTGRAAAEEDALAVAKNLRLEAAPVLIVDTAPRPQPFSDQLAREAGGRCLPLPHARSEALAGAVRAAALAG
jgi:magnesium chelatase subunit D